MGLSREAIQTIWDTLYLVIVGLGLGANAVIWTGYLVMRWSRPRPAKWDGKRVS